MKDNVSFEKWLDPYDSSDLEKLNLGIVDEDEDIYELESDGYIKALEMEENEQQIFNSRPIKTIITNVGAIPIYEHSIPSKVFKMWVGHTTFNIDENSVKIIERTKGVETLEIFSPLRFKVSVGRMFKSRDVLMKIKNNLLKYREALTDVAAKD